MDKLEYEAYTAWIADIRWAHRQSAPINVAIYQAFMPSPLDFGNVFNDVMAVSGPSSGDLKESVKDDDTSSADDSDLSPVKNKSDDLSSAGRSGDDTSSIEGNHLSSVEDNDDDISSFEGNDVSLSTTGAHNDKPASDNITTLRPNNERPNISLDLIKDSAVASKLPGFLAQMRAANQELEEEKSAGTLANRRIELDESDSAAEGEQHIEMNLSLGVLEEKNYETNTTSESDSSNEDDGDIMEKLFGGKRKRGLEDEDEGALKKAKIQEV